MIKPANRLRSIAISLALSVGLAVTLGGCGGGEAEAAGGSNRIELTLAGFGGHGLREQVDLWEREHPGVVVTIVDRGFDEHHEWLQTVAANPDEAPDLALVEIAWIPVFSEQPELFVDLHDYGAGRLESRFLDWRWSNGIAVDGTLFGIPTDVGGLAVAYRVDLFKAAGLPSDRDAVTSLWPTWPQFLTVAESYRSSTDRAFIDDTATIFEVVLNQQSQLFHTESDELDLGADSSAATAWRVTIDAIDANVGASLDGFTPEWNDAMRDGDFAAILAPSWMLNYIRNEAPNTYGLWDIAELPAGGGNLGGSQLTIPAGADQVELAANLATFLARPEQQLGIFERHGNLPSIPELYSDRAIRNRRDDFFNDAPVGAIYTASAARVTGSYRSPDYRRIMRLFRNNLHAIDRFGGDPTTAWVAVVAEAKS